MLFQMLVVIYLEDCMLLDPPQVTQLQTDLDVVYSYFLYNIVQALTHTHM